MLRMLKTMLVVMLCYLGVAGTAQAAGGNYVFDGGTAKQRAEVRSALGASSFDWGLVPAQITIHVRSGIVSHALPGHIWLDGDLLAAGRFSWAIVQDEYAHQVDFFLLDETKRALLGKELGATDWCYSVSGLAHSQYGCERFASTLVWSYWQSADNSYQPRTAKDESAAMSPAKFRARLASLLSAPQLLGPRRVSTVSR